MLNMHVIKVWWRMNTQYTPKGAQGPYMALCSARYTTGHKLIETNGHGAGKRQAGMSRHPLEKCAKALRGR